MSAPTQHVPVATRSDPYAPKGLSLTLESAGAILLALIWVLPLAYAVWAAFHPAEYTTRFVLTAPLTLENFTRAWAAAPAAGPRPWWRRPPRRPARSSWRLSCCRFPRKAPGAAKSPSRRWGSFGRTATR